MAAYSKALSNISGELQDCVK